MNKQEFIEKLHHMGVDTDKALSRFMGNENLFLSFILRLPTSVKFAEIRQHLKYQDEDEFYVQIHNLKGVSGNLGIDPLFECAQAILVEFRTSKFEHIQTLTELVSEAETKYKTFCEIILDYQKRSGAKS